MDRDSMCSCPVSGQNFVSPPFLLTICAGYQLLKLSGSIVTGGTSMPSKYTVFFLPSAFNISNLEHKALPFTSGDLAPAPVQHMLPWLMMPHEQAMPTRGMFLSLMCTSSLCHSKPIHHNQQGPSTCLICPT